MYATANPADARAQPDKVGAFVKARASCTRGGSTGVSSRGAGDEAGNSCATAAGAAKSTLGPSLVYGCTMRAAAAAGARLVAVGGANVAGAARSASPRWGTWARSSARAGGGAAPRRTA